LWSLISTTSNSAQIKLTKKAYLAEIWTYLEKEMWLYFFEPTYLVTKIVSKPKLIILLLGILENYQQNHITITITKS